MNGRSSTPTSIVHGHERRSRQQTDAMVALVLAAIGLGLWLGVEAWHGEGEAWDGPGYFNVALPVMILLCAATAFLRRGRVWLWAVAVVVPQMLALFARGEAGPLWLVGVFVFLLIGALCWTAGILAMVVAKRTR